MGLFSSRTAIIMATVASLLYTYYPGLFSSSTPNSEQTPENLVSALKAQQKAWKVANQELTAMTFNLRHSGIDVDNENSWWKQRRMVAARVVSEYRPTIIGTQEGARQQITDLLSQLPSFYAYSGLPEIDDLPNAVIYDKTQLEELELRTFWLSETPDVARSISWGAHASRKATVVARHHNNSLHPVLSRSLQRFRHKVRAEVEFFVVCTHLDVLSPEARLKGAQLIIDRINKLDPKLPVLLLGDFNSAPGQAPYEAFTALDNGRFSDAWEDAKWKTTEKVTYHHFWGKHLLALYGRAVTYVVLGYFSAGDLPWWSRMHIDWILYRNPTQATTPLLQPYISIVATEKLSNKFPSDHFPVVTLFQIVEPK